MRHVVLVFSLAFTLSAPPLSSLAADKPVVKACHENDDSFPWVLKDRPGLNILLLQRVEKQTGGKLELTPLPWKRCLEETKVGKMDAVVSISYSPTRAAELGVYPMAGGNPDAGKRLHMDSYSLYRLKGSSVSWDGKVLKADGTVGAQSGFSVVDQLKSLGVTVDEGSRSANDSMKKLVLGRIVAVALLTAEGDTTMASSAEFKENVEKISPPLIEKPYYLMFSKQFHANHPEHAKAVWDAVARARESVEYKDLAKNFK